MFLWESFLRMPVWCFLDFAVNLCPVYWQLYWNYWLSKTTYRFPEYEMLEPSWMRVDTGSYPGNRGFLENCFARLWYSKKHCKCASQYTGSTVRHRVSGSTFITRASQYTGSTVRNQLEWKYIQNSVLWWKLCWESRLSFWGQPLPQYATGRILDGYLYCKMHWTYSGSLFFLASPLSPPENWKSTSSGNGRVLTLEIILEIPVFFLCVFRPHPKNWRNTGRVLASPVYCQYGQWLP